MSAAATTLGLIAGGRATRLGGADKAWLEKGGVPQVLRLAAEFMSKLDYVDNWQSEMQEAFAFWSFSEWKAALQEAGFRILENPNAPQLGSRVYTSSWIVENRWQRRVALFQKAGDRLRSLPFPPTNIVLVGEK